MCETFWTLPRYDQLLNSVDGLVILTDRDNCLLCGAYEGVAAGKPMVLSRTTTLMSYFTRGAVFTDNQPDGSLHSIRTAIMELCRRKEDLQREVQTLREELIQRWKVHERYLQAVLRGSTGRRPWWRSRS